MSQFGTTRLPGKFVPPFSDAAASGSKQLTALPESGRRWENWIRPGYYLMRLRQHYGSRKQILVPEVEYAQAAPKSGL